VQANHWQAAGSFTHPLIPQRVLVTTFMRSLSVLLVSLVVVAPAFAAVAPRASGTPCTYSCSPLSAQGLPGRTGQNSGGVLVCYYPLMPGGSANIPCNYDSTVSIIFFFLRVLCHSLVSETRTVHLSMATLSVPQPQFLAARPANVRT
jgi:hypothetical protein